MRVAVKILKWLAVLVVTLLTGLTLAVYLYKDRIIEVVVAEINRSLQVPVQVSRVDIDLFYRLPYIAVAFEGVVLPQGAAEPLLRAERVYVILDPVAAWQGRAELQRLVVASGELNLRVDATNRSNLADLWQPADTAGQAGGNGLYLRHIELSGLQLHYRNDYSGSDQTWRIGELRGRFRADTAGLGAHLQGRVSLLYLATRQWRVERQADLKVELDVLYHGERQTLFIDRAAVAFGDTRLQLNGSLSTGETPYADLEVSATELSIQNLSTFLPPRYGDRLGRYRSRGQIAFQARVRGPLSRQRLPALTATLQFAGVDLHHPGLDLDLKRLRFAGHLHIPDLGDLERATLSLEEATGYLEEHPFEATLEVTNLLAPRFALTFNGQAGLPRVLALAGYPGAGRSSGRLRLNLQARGRLAADTLEKLSLQGTLHLQNLRLPVHDTVAISNLNGVLAFSDQTVSLSQITLHRGHSDLTLNGRLSLPAGGRPPLLQADVQARRLVIEDLTALFAGRADTTIGRPLPLPDLELTCVADRLSFRRFNGRQIAGELRWQDNTLEVIDLAGRTMGGEVRISGLVKWDPGKAISLEARALTRHIHIDSLFYVFENFGQDFITDRYLRGRLYADIGASMTFDPHWNLQRPTLLAEAEMRLEEGELNDFEPIMALAPYLTAKEENLARLRFDNLVNHITIRHDTVFIPEMSIRTNVRNIALGGYQTLDDQINYRIAVPVINERVDKDEAFGAIKKSSSGMPNLLFVVKGTTSNYKVRYDIRRATGKVLKLLDITRIFKKPAAEEADSIFLEEEEFDW